MKGIRMQGGIPLQGKVRIQGSKMRHFRSWRQRFLPMKYPIFRTAHVLQMYIVLCICFGNWDVWCTGRKRDPGTAGRK